MSETRGPRSTYGRNREVDRAGSMGWPDFAISYPNFPTRSGYYLRIMGRQKDRAFLNLQGDGIRKVDPLTSDLAQSIRLKR
jgi:hypothetical protein